jgi:hypothetical protein
MFDVVDDGAEHLLSLADGSDSATRMWQLHSG